MEEGRPSQADEERYRGVVLICKFMGWSWLQYCSTPTPMIAVLLKMMAEENERAAAARNANKKPGIILG